jgi:hypothetical protein
MSGEGWLDSPELIVICVPALPRSTYQIMTKPNRRREFALPLMMAELMMASWETIARRSLMMVQGTCSPAEYRRMAMEKAAAFRQSARAVMSGRGDRAALAPWHKRATANARRLRRRR